MLILYRYVINIDHFIVKLCSSYYITQVYGSILTLLCVSQYQSMQTDLITFFFFWLYQPD